MDLMCVLLRTYYGAPDDDDGNDIDSMCFAGEWLSEAADDDNHQFKAICEIYMYRIRIISNPASELQSTSTGKERTRHTHPFTTDDICKPSKEQLSKERPHGRRDFDTEVLVRCKTQVFVVVDIA